MVKTIFSLAKFQQVDDIWNISKKVHNLYQTLQSTKQHNTTIKEPKLLKNNDIVQRETRT
jgi:hypothetical protein